MNKELTVDGLYGCRAVGGERLGALLADTLLPVKGHSVAGGERLSVETKNQTVPKLFHDMNLG